MFQLQHSDYDEQSVTGICKVYVEVFFLQVILIPLENHLGLANDDLAG